MISQDFKNIFGDDGFRCKYGEKFLTKQFLEIFSLEIAEFYKDKYGEVSCLIGIDTRHSGKLIYKTISRILLSRGIKVIFLGITSSPEISYILKKNKFNFGIMITASHNPYYDNGIKLFNKNGYKLKKYIEKQIEVKIKKKLKIKFEVKKSTVSNRSKSMVSLKKIYFDFLNSLLEKENNNKQKIIIDCSNGASSKLITKLFKKYNNIKIINNRPDGYNINYKCGALHYKLLQQKLIKYKFDYGIALDGDADRCILVDKKKGLIPSEKSLFILLNVIKRKNKGKICASIITNKALEKNIKQRDMTLTHTQVGDRNVIERSIKLRASIGFEPSGHFYYPLLNNSMDGNITLIMIINFLSNNTLKQIIKLPHNKRIIFNMKSNLIDMPYKKLQNSINKINLRKDEKLLLRKSIWDPVYRLYYDYNKISRFKVIRKKLKL